MCCSKHMQAGAHDLGQHAAHDTCKLRLLLLLLLQPRFHAINTTASPLLLCLLLLLLLPTQRALTMHDNVLVL